MNISSPSLPQPFPLGKGAVKPVSQTFSTMKINMIKKLASLCLTLAAGALVAQAQLNWDPLSTGGSGGSGTWNLNGTANWYGNLGAVKWTDNSAFGRDQAIFSSVGGTVTLNTSLSASNLTFYIDGYTISGTGTLTLGSGGIDASSVYGMTTIGNPLVLATGQQMWQIAPGGTLAVNGAVTRNVGAAVDFSASGIVGSSLTNDATGILGAWATVGAYNGTLGDWAAADGSGNVATYTGYTVVSDTANSSPDLTGAASQNWVAGDPLGANNYITTITNTASLHSLVQQGDVSVSSGATLTLGSGGLILRGSSRWMLAGSSTTSLLTSGSSSGELFVHAPNPAATDYRIWPVIADNGTTPVKLVKDGAGFTALANNNNTYSGGTIVNAGILGAAAVGTAPATIAPFGSGNLTVNGGQLQLGTSPGNAFGEYDYTNNIFSNGGIIYERDAFHHLKGALNVGANGVTLGATYNNKGDALNNGFAKGLFVDGLLTGNGPMLVQDSGLETVNAWDSSTVYFTSPGTAAQNTYSGTVTVTEWSSFGGSYLYLVGTNALANATINVNGDNSATSGRFGSPALLFGSGTNLDGVGYATIGGLSGYGSFPLANTLVTQSGSSMGAGVALSVGNNNSNTEYYGVMSGAGSLTKVGTGTLTLYGANTYTGNTTVKGGSLALLGGFVNSTNINVAAGATLDVSGLGSITLAGNQAVYADGTVKGSIDASSGSVISAGTDGGYGTNAITGSLTLETGAFVYFDLGVSASGANDRITVAGSLTANNNVIHLKAPSPGANLEAADYVLFSLPGGMAGSFATAPTWDVAPANAAHYSVVTTANAVTLHYSAIAGPAGAGFALPSPAVRNQNVLITVNAANGTGGSVNSVIVDASPVGGSATLALVNSGNNVWTNTVTVAPGTSAGSKILVATLTDTVPLIGSVNIPLAVVIGNDVWSGVGADNNFSTGLNWTNQTAPGYVGDTLEFAGTTRLAPSVDNNYTVAGVTFDSGAGSFNLGTANSSTLTLTGGLTNNSANVQTLSVPVALSGSPIANAAAGDMVLSGVISGSGSFTKVGNGAVALNATGNSTSGSLNVLGGTLNMTGGTTAFGTGPSYVGYRDQSGNMNINGGTFTAGGEFRVGYSDLNGTNYNAVGNVTVSGGANVSVSKLIVGRGNNNQNRVAGTVTINSGSLSSENDLLLGFAGNNNLGKVVVNTGGTLNIATATKRWVIMSQWDTAQSEIDINGGQMNINANTDIRFSTSGNASTNTFNLNSGAVTFYSDNATTVGGSGVVDLHQGNGTSCVNTFNLNGGTLTVSGITSANAAGSRAFNFNGGTLKAVSDNATFMNLNTGNAVANVRNSGAIIDGGGFNISIDQALRHSAIAGDNATDGGLTKLGAGTLTLNGTNTYTGATLINAGTLALGGYGSISSSANIQTAAGAIFDVSLAYNAYTNRLALSGSGNVNGSVYAAPGAKIYGGTDGTYGTNTFNNDLTLSAGAAGYLDLGVAATGNNDLIVVNGTLTANGNSIHIKAPSTASNLGAADYVLITSANPISGSFASAPVWDVVPANAGHYSVVTSGNTVTLHYNAAVAGPIITSASASPSPVLRNETARLSATVLPGAAAISTVTVDLSPLGGSVVSLVQSNGTTTYTNSTIIPATIAAGTPSLTVTVTDTASLTGSAGISLAINVSTEVWNGGGGNQNWSTNPNWLSGFAPGYLGDGLVFAGSAGLTPNMDANYSITGLTFSNNASGFNLGTANGSTLTITANGIANNSANAQTVNVPVVFSANPAVNAAAGDLTLGQTVDTGGGALAVNGAHNTTLTGTIAAASDLNKAGSGTLTVNGTGLLGGATTISGGTLNVGGVISNTALSTVGSASGNSVLKIAGGNFQAAYAPANIYNSSLQVSTIAGAAGDIQMSSGTLGVVQQLAIGTAAYGAYSQSGGDTTVGGFIALGGTAGGGVFNQSGGTVKMTNAPATLAYAATTSMAVMNLSGNAVFTMTGPGNGLWPGEVGTAVLNLSGSAALSITNDGIILGKGNAAGRGTANLLGGVATVNSVSKGTGSGTFNFNGGTLRANTNTATFMGGLNGAYIYSGGALIDDGGYAVTIPQPLLAPAGYGVVSIPVTSGGSGYLDTPVVAITNITASGSGATAVANVSGGTIVSITITCPGSGYGSGDTLGVSLAGGGGSGAVIGTPVLGVNTGGGLTKLGAGTLTLSGANTYAGDTTVSTGTLALGQPALNTNSAVTIASGAVLQLNFAATNTVANLVLNGVTQTPGIYNSTTGAPYITGTGSLLIPSNIGPGGPGYLTNSVSGNTLTLSWPAGQGWVLQVQTNNLSTGLGTNWVDVPGSSAVNSTNITVNPSMPATFYRLKY